MEKMKRNENARTNLESNKMFKLDFSPSSSFFVLQIMANVKRYHHIVANVCESSMMLALIFFGLFISKTKYYVCISSYTSCLPRSLVNTNVAMFFFANFVPNNHITFLRMISPSKRCPLLPLFHSGRVTLSLPQLQHQM